MVIDVYNTSENSQEGRKTIYLKTLQGLSHLACLIENKIYGNSSNLKHFLVCLKPPEQFFSYPAIVTITGDRAANLGLCLALMAFSSEGSFSWHTYYDMGP
jgi:hypothetical protein